MCPIVPMFTCGFDRSNFSFAIAHYPRYALFNSFKSLFLERGTGFEPATIALEERDSTVRSEEHTSELQSRLHLVCRLLLEKKKKNADASSERCKTRQISSEYNTQS